MGNVFFLVLDYLELIQIGLEYLASNLELDTMTIVLGLRNLGGPMPSTDKDKFKEFQSGFKGAMGFGSLFGGDDKDKDKDKDKKKKPKRRFFQDLFK